MVATLATCCLGLRCSALGSALAASRAVSLCLGQRADAGWKSTASPTTHRSSEVGYWGCLSGDFSSMQHALHGFLDIVISASTSHLRDRRCTSIVPHKHAFQGCYFLVFPFSCSSSGASPLAGRCVHA